jgi:hypothetical protein|tara:strand:+ start:184 stop:495 length:312 start_codon:yes stop_codon:yes gene_type:complete
MSLNILKKLCTPAYVYLVISIIFIIVSSVQNYGNVNTYCLGDYECDVSNTYLIFILKIVYVAFWTWLLNLMCGAGYSTIAWIIVLLPFILMFIILAGLFVQLI